MRGSWVEPYTIEERLTRHDATRVVRRLAGVLRPYRWAIALATLFLVAQTATLLAGPAFVAHGIDAGLRAGDAGALNLSAALYLGAAIVGLVLGRFVILQVARIGETFLRDLRRRVFRHLLSLGLDYFEREKTGRLVARMTSDIDAMQELVQTGLVMFVQNVLIFIGAVVIIFILSWQLALCTLIVVPPVFFASRWFRRESNRAYLEVRERIGTNLATLQEGLSGVRVVQAFAREGAFTRRFRNTNEAQFDAHLETVRISTRYFPVIELSGVVGMALIVGVGGLFVERDIVTVGVVAAFVLYLTNLFEPVQQLSQLYNVFQSAGAALQKLFTLLDTAPSVAERPGAVDLPAHGALELEHVTFAYGQETDGSANRAPESRHLRPATKGQETDGSADRAPESRRLRPATKGQETDGSANRAPESRRLRPATKGKDPVLHDVSLRVEPGERLALVGPTGAGKSTVAKLAARFYDPGSGTVSFGGVPLIDATLASLRERIVVVPQEGFLFAGTVRDNIRVGKADATDAEIGEAVDALGLRDRIAAWPDGLDTEVRERGSRLSAGERQLVSLLRAALADPTLLVLDEATSNLDPGTERAVERALERLMEGRTVVVIAHRLSTAARADRVAVIDHGRVAEIGTHDDLIAREGAYALLFAAWTSGARERSA